MTNVALHPSDATLFFDDFTAAFTNLSLDSAMTFASIPTVVLKSLSLRELRCVSYRMTTLAKFLRISQGLPHAEDVLYSLESQQVFVTIRRQGLVALKRKFPRAYGQGGGGNPPTLFGIPVGL